MFATIRSWLGLPSRAARPRPAHNRNRTRLAVESLEGRVVPTTGWVSLDGGYKDVLNGMVWVHEANTPGGPGYTWYNFMNQWAADSTRNGYDDWRLPDLVETRRAVANDVYFLEDPGDYLQWTSTEYDRKNVWYVNLETGAEGTFPKTGAVIPSWGMVRDSASYVDDGGTGFATSGAWSQSSTGYLGDSRAAGAGDGSRTATWTFSGLEVGETYRVATTWTAAPGRATNAPFALIDGGQTEATLAVDQSAAPDDYLVGGTAWESLGTVTVDSGQLTVRLNDLADGTVVADAVRIFKVSGAPVDPRLSVSDASVVEGAAGTSPEMVFTVNRTGDLSQAVSVDYSTADGTATAGSDYTPATGTLTFAPGETSKEVHVTVLGDAVAEQNEAFNLVLSNAAGGTIADGTGVGTIITDDAPPPLLSVNDVSLAEGRNGTTLFTFTVSLSSPPSTAVTVNYATADGTAKVSGGDYTAASGTLSFAAGETSKTITIAVKGDRSKESDETFYLNLFDPVGAVIYDGLGLGTILNDD